MRKILFLVIASIAILSAEETFSESSEKTLGSATVASGLFFDASYLFLKAEIDGLVFAQTFDVSPVNAPTDIVQVKNRPKSLDFQWSSGVTAGVGYIFPQREQYQLSAYWTYLHSSADKKIHQNGTIDQHFIAPMWLPFLSGAVADRADANWALNFNVADLALSRNVLIGNWFSLAPKLGLRAAWVNQDYKVKYHGGFNFNDGGVSDIIFEDTSLVASNEFTGIGPRVGTELQFYLMKNLSIMGGFFASVLYGEFEVRELFTGGLLVDFGAGAQLLHEQLNLRKDFSAVRPAIETKIGLCWDRFFNDEQNRILIGAFYRLDYWFDQNEFINQANSRDSSPINGTTINQNNNIINIRPDGNLQMQGLEVELRIEF